MAKTFLIPFTVDKNGDITNPTTPRAQKGDVIEWQITNSGTKNANVHIKDFKIHNAVPPNGPPINTISFTTANPKTIPAGANGVIRGTVIPAPVKLLLIKYNVRVTGPANKDHDPDLEVKPPDRKHLAALLRKLARRKGRRKK